MRSFGRWARIAVPRSALRRVVESLGRDQEWWASPGVGIAHWRFPETDAVALIAARHLAESAGGSLVLLDAPDAVKRAVGAWGTAPATLDLMRRLKKAFDPSGILNPGRFVV
jgi:glycolate oxidase FAD binding subunit